MKIFVTGATGFIGTHLVRALLQKGESIRIFCRPSSDVSTFNDRNLEIWRGELLDGEGLKKAMKGCDRVFHLAAYARNWAKDPRTFYEVNVEGLKNILEASLKGSVQKVVFTSSSLTIGPSHGTPVNESEVTTNHYYTEYQRSKSLAEAKAKEYVEKGLPVVIVNPTRVFGPGLLNEGNSVTKLIQMYLKGKWRILLGDGSAIGNYVYVQDVVKGHLLAMEKGRVGEKYILGGENLSFVDFLSVLSELSHLRYRLFHIPPSLALAYSQLEKFRAILIDHYPLITPGWVRIFLKDWGYSSEKAERELGYTITPIRDALKITIEWLEKEGEDAKDH